MTHQKASKIINVHLREFLDSYVLVGIMPDGKRIIVRGDGQDKEHLEMIDKLLVQARSNLGAH